MKLNEGLKFNLEIEDFRHGRFKKMWVITTNKLPICAKCFDPIEKNSMIYWCKQNPRQFWHVDCFDDNHHKSFDGVTHEDLYCLLKVTATE